METKSSSIENDAILNRKDFNKTINLIGVKVTAKLCSNISEKFKSQLFQRPRMKRVYEVDNEPEKRIVLLAESYSDLSLSEIPADFQDYLKEINAVPVEYKLNLTYDHLVADEVLTQLIPAGCEIPSSFEQVGHVAHLNLRELLLPFKKIIGQVILDKNVAIKTVVNKIGSIETEFRTFPMEVIGGVSDLNVTVRESNARFMFNFEEVYWNSRLQMEHNRLINLITKRRNNTSSNNNIIVADMMAGVGPFSIPLAMNKVQVCANDLNPASYKYLVSNAKLNKCEKFINSYGMDGRDFILLLAKKGIMIHEAIMNLPASATDFLDVFIGFATRYPGGSSSSNSNSIQENKLIMPRIHVYAFSTEADPIVDITKRVALMLQCDYSLIRIDTYERGSLRDSKKRKRKADVGSSSAIDKEDDVDLHGEDDAATGVIAEASAVVNNSSLSSNSVSEGSDEIVLDGIGHIVRDVSPQKVMVCLSFQLPLQVAYANPVIIPKNA